MNERKLEDEVHLKILRILEVNPKISQREMARETGVSLGKLNYCLQSLVQVGLVQMSNFAKSSKKKNYIYALTPSGIAKKVKLTVHFLEFKQMQYEMLKAEIAELKKDLG